MTKTISLGFLSLLFGLLAAAAPARAQAPPAPAETVRGEVVRIDAVASGDRGTAGVHMTLRTERESLQVALGPSWYLEKQELKLAAGDRVEVRGARAGDLFVAAEVRKGDAVLRLRDARGLPLWRRGPGRR